MSAKKKNVQPQTARQTNPAAAKASAVKTGTPDRAMVWGLAVLIAVITWFAYSPSLRCGFTNWDDNIYVEKNTLIMKPPMENLGLYFTEVVSSNYHPLTMISLGMDYQASKLDPERYHTVNLIFHSINALLLFFFIYSLTRRNIFIAGLVAAFFALHPMHVESVTWVSERKDVLYVFFFLLGLLGYEKLREGSGSKYLWYPLITLAFVASVLSKAMAVVFPVVLLLIDYLKGRKLDKWVFLEKAPWLLFSAIMGYVAVKAQVNEAIASFGTFTLFQRFMFGTYGFLMYIVKLVWPFDLSAFYPYPFLIEGRLPYLYYLAPVIFSALAFVVWLTRNKTRNIVFGFGFYFVTVALVLQFISVGMAIMADRYSYLSYVGLFFIIGSETWRYLEKNGGMKIPVYLAVAGVSLWWASLTYNRTKVWENSETLWTDVLKQFPNTHLPYKNRGNYYVDNKLYDKAFDDFNQFLALSGGDAKVYSNRGNIYGMRQQFDKAMADYTKSLELDSVTNVEAYLNRAITFSMMKQFDKALADYTRAQQIDPKAPNTYVNRAYVYLELGQYEKSIADYNKFIEIGIPDGNTYFYRALAYFKANKYKEAIEDNTKALEFKPNDGSILFNRSVCYKFSGDYPSALRDALRAKELGQPVTDEYLNELKAGK